MQGSSHAWLATLEPLLRAVPTNSKAFLRGCMDVLEKQFSRSVVKIQKEKWGNLAFFKDNQSTILVKSFKIQSNVWRSFPNLSSVISEKCMGTPNFLFG